MWRLPEPFSQSVWNGSGRFYKRPAKRVEGECGLENWEQEEWQKYMEEQEIRKEIQSRTDAFRAELQDFYRGEREAGARLMERTTQLKQAILTCDNYSVI